MQQSDLFPDLPCNASLESLAATTHATVLEAFLTDKATTVSAGLPPTRVRVGKSDTLTQGAPSMWLNGRGGFKRKIMFIAAAPRQVELDQQSPLAGNPSFRLIQTLESGVGLDLEQDCYLTYLVKYAIPHVDSLSKVDIAHCLPILKEEIARLNPSYIVCLGTNVFKALTHIQKEVDEYVGNTVFSELLQKPVGVVWPPTTCMSSPESEDDWILDLRCVLNRYQPICKSNWEEQDELPVHRPTSTEELRAVVDGILAQGSQDIALDTEFIPGRSWLETVMFKITIATSECSIDLHLLEPKYGYKPKFYPATKGRNKGVAAQYFEGKAHRMFFDSTEQRDQYIVDHPLHHQPLEAYVGEYMWTFQGTPEEVKVELTRLLCREGNHLWGHNAREDYKLLLKFGVNVLRYVECDTITLGKCVEEKQRFALEAMTRKWLGAPSHKLALAEWLTSHSVHKGKLPYIFIPRSIQDPYATMDARRTFDLREPLYADMERQHEEALAAKEPSIKDAYFNAKMPEYYALLEMEILGQPIDPYALFACMDWYESQRKSLMKECIAEVKRLTGWPSFNPDAPQEIGKLLFDVLGLTPLHSTDKPPIPWDEVMQLPPAEQAGKRAASDQETLEMLSAEHPIASMLNTCRIMGTLEKNYLRKGARWYFRPEDEEEDAFSLSAEPAPKVVARRKTAEKYLAEKMTPEEYWDEVIKDRKSKAISQVISDNCYVYTNYRELLETDRLASYPNVSAIKKGEEKEVQDLVGEMPPCAIRNVISCHEDPVHLPDVIAQVKAGKGLDIINFQRSKSDREWVMIESDWGTGEVWYLVVISGDKSGIDIMGNPERDIHASVARNMFPKVIPQDMGDLEVKANFKKLRDAAKPFVFGIPYGRGGSALVRQLNTEETKRRQKIIKSGGDPGPYEPFDPEKGEEFILSYQQTLPEGWAYLEEQKQRVEYPGYLVSPWGFRRRFPKNITGKSQLAAFQREASNWQIQHGIAAVMMEATKAYLDIKQKNPRMPMFLCDILHDATKYMVHNSILDEVKDIIEYIMDTGLNLPFKPGAKLRHSIDIAYSWCGTDVDIATIPRTELTWGEAMRVIPTADLAATMVGNLRMDQIRPELTEEIPY
jgi:uracil-DNA glycosylase family 4